MKNLLLFIVLCVSSTLSVSGQNISWNWSIEAGGQSIESPLREDAGTRIVADDEGNFYVLGVFNTDTFKLKNTQLTHKGKGNPFIAKFDPQGNVIWARKLSGSNTVFEARGADLTIYNHDLFIVGSYRDTLTGNGHQVISTGYSDVFVAKYTLSGTELWIKSFGSKDHNEDAEGIAVDTSGNIIITGSFYSDFLTFGSTVLTNNGSLDFFVVKLDNDGNPIWAKNSGNASQHAYASGMSVTSDTKGNVIVSGYYTGIFLQTGNDTLINEGSYDIFIIKYAPDGNQLWAKRAGGSYSDQAWEIGTDSENNILIAGTYNSFIFYADTDSLILNTGPGCRFCNDLFLLKYDENGKITWVRQSYSNIINEAASYSLDIDAEDNVYTIGNFNGHIRLGDFEFTANGNSNQDVLIVRYDAKGNVNWVKTAGGPNTDIGLGIKAGQNNEVYVTGKFRSTDIIFDADTLSNHTGYYNFFLARIDECDIPVTLFLSDTIVLNQGDSIRLVSQQAFSTYCWSTGDIDNSTWVKADNLGPGNHYVTLKVSDINGCMGTDSVLIAINGMSSSLLERHDFKYHVYPNPARELINIKINNPAFYTLYTVTGVIAQSGQLVSGNNTLNMDQIEAGIYLLTIQQSGQIFTTRLVIY